MFEYAVVIPAYNASRTLEEALESVFSQSVPPAEVVVVDDGSTDDTAARARAFDSRVTVLEQQNSGPGNATSNGVRATSSPVIATLDADDLWLKEKMALQLAELEGERTLSGLFCKQRVFRHGDNDRSGGRIQSGLNRSCLVIYREVFDSVGDIIDPPGGCGEMIDWLGRVREAGYQLKELDQILALRRAIPGSMTSQRDAEKNRGYLHVARQAMLRRRQQEQGNS
ncbi:hypothetical protein BOW53_14560 [Solemya pervernicosa gill symbiont]|uniref:Glycosyltransferase 2-like domain-containing protein n=2 Tax=Gammaproteobacteria incertae sedis TaxID=118884 RepID=A0A1T2L141_9GAMM|nr:glycosyltransferase family A protein [Candidatus Reidiella endopervernicosa]OOZ38740.1 hypothetical protein BOW53_14560 [Solemya pervernicosa gill symbiont]QKQ25859.1 glycosyltransferase family 2 protein [Candidatus Reidiella endopervernicosa]